MGGAANISTVNESKKMKRVISNVVSGNVKNVYTEKDIILMFYSISSLKKAIGRNPIFKDDQNNIKSH
jgi:hypothetical protein